MNLRLYIYFFLSYHKVAYLSILFFIEIQDTLCYTEYYQPGKQVQILYETVAVRCKKSMF